MSAERSNSFKKVEVENFIQGPHIVKLGLFHVTPYRHFPNSFSEPVGIEQLAGTLTEKGVPVVLHLALIKNADGISEANREIEEGNYTHVGIGLPLGSLEDGEVLLDFISTVNNARVNQKLEPVKVFLGGNLPTSASTDYMKSLIEKFNFVTVVRGWGDKPFLSLMQKDTQTGGEDYSQVSGLIYWDGQKVIVNPLFQDDPDFVAGKPLRVLTEPTMVANLPASENCSHPSCTFCSRMPFVMGKEVWRTKPMDQVISQIVDFNNLGIKQATLTDEEALGTSAEHAIEQGERLSYSIIEAKEKGIVDRDFTYAFSTRSDSIVGLLDSGRKDILVSLSKSGLTRIFLGVETGVSRDFQRWDGLPIPSQGRRYGKGIEVSEHVRAIHALHESGIGIEVGFIPFDPLLDLGEIKENAKFLLDNGLARFTSTIFNSLRIQSGAKYELVLDRVMKRLRENGIAEGNRKLLGELNPSTLQRHYTYLHPLVEKVVSLFSTAEIEDRDTIYALKTYYRSKLITGEPTAGRGFETLTRLRELDLQLMIRVVDWAESSLHSKNLSLSQYNQLDLDSNVQSILDMHRMERQNVWEIFLETEMPDYLRETILARRNNFLK